MIIRPATMEDVQGMIAVKESLVLQRLGESSTEGGFLLGTDAQGYRDRIAGGCAWVLDVDGVKGFSIVLPDAVLRMSAIWQRRTEIQWNTNMDLESTQIGYFDQLAVAKGPWRTQAPILAITNLIHFLSFHPDYLLSTTVRKPVQNLAAVPYLEYIDAKIVGQIEETDQKIGWLLSDLWLTSQSSLRYFLEHPPSPKIAMYIEQAQVYFQQHKP